MMCRKEGIEFQGLFKTLIFNSLSSHFCLIDFHIFYYPDSRLSGLLTQVPTSPDNRGSTVHVLQVSYCYHY